MGHRIVEVGTLEFQRSQLAQQRFFPESIILLLGTGLRVGNRELRIVELFFQQPSAVQPEGGGQMLFAGGEVPQTLSPKIVQAGRRFGEVGRQKGRNFFFIAGVWFCQVICSVKAAYRSLKVV